MEATRTFAELQHIVSTIGADHLTLQQLAAALARAARGKGTYNTWDTGSPDFADFLDALSQHLTRVVRECDARTVSRILRAWSKLQYVNAAMLSACLRHFCQPIVLSTASSTDLAYVVHALATLVDGDQLTATAAVQAALQHTPYALIVCVQRYSDLADEDKPQCMSAMLWGLAKLAASGQPVITPAVMQAMHHTPGVLAQCLDACWASADKAPQKMADTLWALARLADLGDPALTAAAQAAIQGEPKAVPALLARVCNELGRARIQAVNEVLWAAAKLQIMPKAPDFSRLIVAVDSAAACLNAQELSEMLWALEELQQLYPWGTAAA